jgi:DNA-binding transcriptional MerR regulator
MGIETTTTTIGALAQQHGVTPRTIRFYEDRGLLAPRRAESGQRLYDHRDCARLTLICRGKRMGFSLAEIKDFLDLYDSNGQQAEQMRYLVRRGGERIAGLERQLQDVQDTLRELRAMVTAATEHLRRHRLDDSTSSTELHSSTSMDFTEADHGGSDTGR